MPISLVPLRAGMASLAEQVVSVEQGSGFFGGSFPDREVGAPLKRSDRALGDLERHPSPTARSGSVEAQ